MNQDKIWDVYQNDPELRHMGCRDGGRIPFIARHLPNGSRVLNIGVGRGSLEKFLSEKGVDVYCLDPSDKSITNLRESLGLGDKARVGYSQEIPFSDGCFDYVVMTEVLEHLSDEILDKTRKEVARVLKAGGAFIGSVPADEDLIESVVVCPECGKRFHRWGHLQSFSRSQLEEYLNRSFDKVLVKRVVFSDWPNLNWKGKASAIAKRIQAKCGAKGSGQNLFFVAKIV